MKNNTIISTISIILSAIAVFASCLGLFNVSKAKRNVESNTTTVVEQNEKAVTTEVEEETTELPITAQIEVKNFYNKRSRIGVEMQKLFTELYTLDGMTGDILNRFCKGPRGT